MLRSLLFTFVLICGSMPLARAHSVWIEPRSGQMVVRFAEPDGKYEKSPGYLDSLSIPVAFTVRTNSPVAVEAPKQPDHFLLVSGSATNILCAETAFTVRGGRKPNFYARWQPDGLSSGVPMLTFDIVPTGKAGEVRVYFRGKPLGGLKATLRSPDEKEAEVIGDTDGFLRFEPKQSGQYLLTIAHHRENLPGFHGGRAYEQTSHNTALTWIQP